MFITPNGLPRMNTSRGALFASPLNNVHDIQSLLSALHLGLVCGQGALRGEGAQGAGCSASTQRCRECSGCKECSGVRYSAGSAQGAGSAQQGVLRVQGVLGVQKCSARSAQGVLRVQGIFRGHSEPGLSSPGPAWSLPHSGAPLLPHQPCHTRGRDPTLPAAQQADNRKPPQSVMRLKAKMRPD